MVIRKVISTAVLFVLCLLLISKPACGADWKFIGKSADGNVSVSVDVDSIKWVSEDIVRSSQKFVYAKPKLLNASQKPIREVVAYREWNCGEETYNDLKITFCYADGTKETENYKYALWHQIKQNSPEDDLHDYVCNHE
jgi:Surface-adhesin protein E